MICRRAIAAAVLLSLCGLTFDVSRLPAAPAEEVKEVDSVDRDYSTDLKRFPPVPAQRALETFEVEPGFKLQLAAAEPLVTDPVAMAFDEHGRLYVVEMLGYSEDADDMLGRIRLLEDADRDGVFETSTVFADGLGWPTAVICYDGGIFVGAAPDILYFKDTDGDRRADERRVVFIGFGTDNVQGLLNSFRWGLDNRIHVAVSRNGADLRLADQPNAEPLVLRGRNFAFDPKTLEFEATSGASQHGFCFDPWGNAFTCHNSDHIQQVMYDDRDMSRNPYVRPPAALKSIAVEGPAADVFRISPIEPWREIRTRLRVKGIVPGVVEGGGRAGGYFTSATGVTIYDGDAWPKEFYGNAFIGDVGSNLVHRKLMERSPESLAYVAKRATPNREFIASRDTWFRPVQFANGPDGNLYILDMYREVIEHPASLPPVLKKHLDLTSGRDRGRIYRVVREDTSNNLLREQLSRDMPGDANTEELVAMLNHANGWHRTTAARVLLQQNDPASKQLLQNMLYAPARDEAQILALHLLASLNALDGASLSHALASKAPSVRQNAVRIAARWLPTQPAKELHRRAVEHELLSLAKANEPAVLYEIAFALGKARDVHRFEVLADIIRKYAADEYIRAAVFSSLGGREDKAFPISPAQQVLHWLIKAKDFRSTAAGRESILELVRQIGARGDELELSDTSRHIAVLQDSSEDVLASDMLVALLSGAGPKAHELHEQLTFEGVELADLFEPATALAADEKAPIERRTTAIATLALTDFEAAAPLLRDLLAPSQPQAIQLASLAALEQFPHKEAASTVLDAWPGMSPALRFKAAE
jgi:putative membrane-bound dehydrogenase-like protein